MTQFGCVYDVVSSVFCKETCTHVVQNFAAHPGLFQKLAEHADLVKSVAEPQNVNLKVDIIDAIPADEKENSNTKISGQLRSSALAQLPAMVKMASNQKSIF